MSILLMKSPFVYLLPDVTGAVGTDSHSDTDTTVDDVMGGSTGLMESEA